MLSEEAREFFLATTLVDRLDAWADFAFVAIGAACKHMAVRSTQLSFLEREQEEFLTLAAYREGGDAGSLCTLLDCARSTPATNKLLVNGLR